MYSKLIPLHQIHDASDKVWLVSDLWLNKDIIRFVVEAVSPHHVRYSKLSLIADDKYLEIMETPEEINNLCNFVQGVEIVRRSKTTNRNRSGSQTKRD